MVLAKAEELRTSKEKSEYLQFSKRFYATPRLESRCLDEVVHINRNKGDYSDNNLWVFKASTTERIGKIRRLDGLISQ